MNRQTTWNFYRTAPGPLRDSESEVWVARNPRGPPSHDPGGRCPARNGFLRRGPGTEFHRVFSNWSMACGVFAEQVGCPYFSNSSIWLRTLIFFSPSSYLLLIEFFSELQKEYVHKCFFYFSPCFSVFDIFHIKKAIYSPCPKKVGNRKAERELSPTVPSPGGDGHE